MGERFTIGVLAGSANSPHVQNFMQGMHNAAITLDVNIVFFQSFQMASYYRLFTGEKADQHYDEQASVVYDYVGLGNIDALIFTYEARKNAMDDEQFAGFLERFEGIPYVVLDDLDETKKGTSVKTDNYNGMLNIVKHLVEVHKYKKLTYLSGPKNSLDSMKRLKAFKDVLKENNIPITDKMIEYGDFTKNVEEEIEALLDNNPDMECMVCANDMMAFMAYKVMKERGIVVGKDIAVTGYDDWVVAEALNPPLTTSKQNELDIAYIAVEEAIKLCKGDAPHVVTVPAVTKIRSSCGCQGGTSHLKLDYSNLISDKTRFVNQVVSHLSQYALLSKADKRITEHIENEFRNIVEGLVASYLGNEKEGISKIYFNKQIENLLSGKYSDYISIMALLDIVSNCLSDVLMRADSKEHVDKLTRLFARITGALQAAIVSSSNNDKQTYQEDNMYIPLVSRDMITHVNDRSAFYMATLKILAFNRVKSSYIVTAEKPFRKKKKNASSLPTKMYLSAFQMGTEMVAYSDKDKTKVVVNQELLDKQNPNKRFSYFVYNLFVGNMQYGIFTCEIEPKDSMLMYQASQQMSIAIEYREGILKQERMREKLENFVDEVNEKNRILSFISEYDPMTECLNRRGFIEQVSEKMRICEGEKVTVIMADMDGLKYINDTFGHPDGDEAIKAAGLILKEALGSNAIVARAGGDEYTAFISGERRGGKEFSNVIINTIRRYNDVTKKPYYVDMSVGYCDFICSPKADIEIMLKNADVMLYEVKKKKKEQKNNR